MICNLCGTSEATVHLTEIINDQMMEIHLCDTCAQEKGTAFKTHFNVGDLFAGLAEFSESPEAGHKKKEVRKCATCKISYDEFSKGGRLGCADCYLNFSDYLLPLIKRIQRASSHIGKKPSNISDSTRAGHDLRVLQDRLRKCVQDEAFEDAASLRDEIKKLQVAMKKKKSKKK